MEFKVGDIFNIHSYKHDHKIHRSWDQAIYIDQTKDYAIFGNYKTLVTESDGRTWRTREPAIMYFSKDNWFNIIGQIKSTGIYYYCNIASPYIIENNTIKYIDYDLDLRVFPDGSFKVLDRGEYQYHPFLRNEWNCYYNCSSHWGYTGTARREHGRAEQAGIFPRRGKHGSRLCRE